MWPKLVYESLPFLYLTMGIAILVYFDSPIAFISSLLFLAAGILVLSWRFSYRKSGMRRDDAMPHESEG